MFCGHCGKEIKETDNWCPYCGANLSEQREANEEGTTLEVVKEETGNEAHKVADVKAQGVDSGDNKSENQKTIAQETCTGVGDLDWYRPKIKKEPLKILSFWKILLLSILTCGIYELYVLHCFAKDMNVLCKGDGKESPNFIKVFLLSIITCGVYGCYWQYMQGQRLYEASEGYGVKVEEKGSTVLFWLTIGVVFLGLGPLIAFYILIRNRNKLAEQYNAGRINTSSNRTQKEKMGLLAKILCVVGFVQFALVLAGLFIFFSIFSNLNLDEDKYGYNFADDYENDFDWSDVALDTEMPESENSVSIENESNMEKTMTEEVETEKPVIIETEQLPSSASFEEAEQDIPRYYFEDLDKESLYEGNMVECLAGYQIYMPADWALIDLDAEYIADGISFGMNNPEWTGFLFGGYFAVQDDMDAALLLDYFKSGRIDAYMNDIPVIYQKDDDTASICFYINDKTLGWFGTTPASDENIRKIFGVAVRSLCKSETASGNLQNSEYTLSNENEIDYYAAYQPILDEACAVYGDVGYCSYSLYDIDNDGIKELITSVGTCTADWTNNIYTIDEGGNASVLGQFGREVTLYEAEDGNGIYTVWGFQGCQEVTRITKKGSECYQETILANEIAPGEDYISYPNQISSSLIDDSSLLSEKVSEGETQYSDQRKLEKPEGNVIKHAEENNVINVGEVVETDDLRIKYLSSGQCEASSIFSEPKEGYMLWRFEFEIKNISEESQSVSDMLGWECYADNVVVDQKFLSNENLSGIFSSGRTIKGAVFFEVPIDSKNIELEYDPGYKENIIVFAGK